MGVIFKEKVLGCAFIIIHMKRYALKFAYDGQFFNGYARQPDHKTIEGDIIEAMKFLDIISTEVQVSPSSRTDKGVSALGNVLSLKTNFEKAGIIPALNSKLSYIWFYGIAEIPEDMNIRHAKERHYRYILPVGEMSADAIRKSSELFIGEHDFLYFSKKDRSREIGNTVRSIKDISVTEHDGFIRLDIYGTSFLWQMVRRMIWAIEGLAKGKLSEEEVKAALAGQQELRAHPAPSNGLTLVDVKYDLEFEHSFPKEKIINMWQNAMINSHFYNAFNQMH